MLNRNALLLVAGAAFIAFDASAASAQARSTRRIPVSKEAPGEVAPRVDTVTVYRTDTLNVTRVDTLRLTNTVTRTDTVIQQVQMAPRHIGGLYVGLAGGLGLPYGSLRTVNQPGELAQLQVGYQPMNSWIGARLDGTWNRFARNPSYGGFMGDRSNVLNLNLDARVDLPIFNSLLGSSVKFRPYLVGGGTYIRYNNLRMKISDDSPLFNTCLTTVPATCVGDSRAVIATNGGGVAFADDSWHDDWGWNYGGGLAFHAGRKEIFIEARAIRFKHDSNDNDPNPFKAAYQVPIVFGVNWF